MMKLPDPVQKVVDALAELPSIGPRQAVRLAFYLIGQGKTDLHALAESIDALRSIKICERCYFIHQNDDGLCDVCMNPARDQRIIMVVEKETDYLSLENTKKFTGRYFIVGPVPKTGFLETWQKTRIAALKKYINEKLSGAADEIILGFSPTTLGDFQASLILKELAPLAKRMSRLGRGLRYRG